MRPRRPINPEHAKLRRQANATYKKEYIEQYGEESWDDEQRRKKEHAEYDRQERKANRELKANLRREKKILTYMKKNDVLYYHHDRSDSSMKQIESALRKVKEDGAYTEYDSYIWNRQGEGNSYMALCQFHNIYSPVDGFDTIYDVPLDGTYQFHIYDSGQRGLGSFNYITAAKVEEEVAVPFVNPGGFPQITV